MKYVGSKNRLAKDIAPIIQSYLDKGDWVGYLEPFVGGANMIDKIHYKNKIGFDKNKYLISLLKQAQENSSVFPETYNEDVYQDVKKNPDKYNDWFVGLVGFCTFGAKWFGGFPRGFKEDKVTPRDIVAESIRNIKKQSKNLKGITFKCKDFEDIENISGFVIYCDPPYRDTTKYSTGDFPYERFYDWCREMSKSNLIIVSEYNMPDDFKCIWEKDVKTSLDSNRINNPKKQTRTEKLFVLNYIKNN